LNIASATAVSEGAAKSLDVLRKRTFGRRNGSGSDKSDQLEEKPAAMLPMSELKAVRGEESALHTSVSPSSVRNSVSSMQSMDSVSDGDDIHLEMTDDEDEEVGGGSHRFLKIPQLK
jgi:hypothetical protein